MERDRRVAQHPRPLHLEEGMRERFVPLTAIKLNVSGGVKHRADRCCNDTSNICIRKCRILITEEIHLSFCED